MEYRIHSQNGYKTSIISLDFSSLKSNNKNIVISSFESILTLAISKGINLISISLEDIDLIKTIYNWNTKTNNNLLFSVHVGYNDIFLGEHSTLDKKKEIFKNRFQNLELHIPKLMKDIGISKIPFFSLYYAKHHHFQSFELQPVIEKLKKELLIDSFGIYCQYLSDALYLANSVSLDHLEVEIDINTSSEMLHSLFKTAKKRNISIFCYQHETIDQSKIESKNITNNLVNILRRGENRFIDYINGEKSISTKNVFKFALKKNLMEAYQSIAVKIFKPDEIDTIQSVLYYPYLSFDESEFLQRAITPIQFPSPKKTK